MNPIPRNPFLDFDDLLDIWRPVTRGVEPKGGAFTPRVDIADMKDHYEITAELPGVSKDDLSVTLQEGVLTIEAETKKEEKEEKDGRVIRQERRYGKFTRSFNLGPEVSQGDVSASYTDGVLQITVPKVEPKAPEARTIEVH